MIVCWFAGRYSQSQQHFPSRVPLPNYNPAGRTNGAIFFCVSTLQLTTFCAWFQINLLCIVSVMCIVSNQICNQYVSKKLWLHPFLQLCREVTVDHESNLFEMFLRRSVSTDSAYPFSLGSWLQPVRSCDPL